MNAEKSLTIRDKKFAFVQRLKLFIKKSQAIYNNLMADEKRAQTITIAVYILCFLLNIFYTPWLTNSTDSLVSGELSNEKFHLFFFDSIFYGISELVDLLTWADSIEYVIFAVAILSLKDICKEFCLDYANGELADFEDEESKENLKMARENTIKKDGPIIKKFKSKVKHNLNEFMVDNILLYLSTLLLYFLSTAGMSLLDFLFNNLDQDLVGILTFIGMGVLLLILIYAIPNLLKLFMYVVAISGISLVMGKAESISLFNDLIMSLISCGLILIINKITGIISDKASSYLYTKEGLSDLKDTILGFLSDRGIDSSLRFIVLVFSPFVVATAEYLMIRFTVYLLSLS